MPQKELCEAIEPFYRKPQEASGSSVDVERMLRIRFLQHWLNLSYPAAEDALYDSQVLRNSVGIDLGGEPAPDETTISRFRRLMEKYNLGSQFFHLVNEYFQENEIKISRVTIVDASIINAPNSTKNKKKERDPEMKQTRKGRHWYFGMKAHIGADSRTKLIHSMVATAANVHDFRVLPDLLHGEETRVWGDSAYTGRSRPLRITRPGPGILPRPRAVDTAS